MEEGILFGCPKRVPVQLRYQPATVKSEKYIKLVTSRADLEKLRRSGDRAQVYPPNLSAD